MPPNEGMFVTLEQQTEPVNVRPFTCGVASSQKSLFGNSSQISQVTSNKNSVPEENPEKYEQMLTHEPEVDGFLDGRDPGMWKQAIVDR